MKSRFEELQKDLYELGASVYQQAGAQAGTTPGGNGSSGNGASGASSAGEDVIDAEFTESK
jgi:molecular chaperone DnaK